jgi:hypothetical protein
MDAMNGVILHDYELKVGWGKSVPIPLVPIYPPEAVAAAKAAMHGVPVAAVAAPWASAGGRHGERSMHQGAGPDIEVKMTADLRVRWGGLPGRSIKQFHNMN